MQLDIANLIRIVQKNWSMVFHAIEFHSLQILFYFTQFFIQATVFIFFSFFIDSLRTFITVELFCTYFLALAWPALIIHLPPQHSYVHPPLRTLYATIASSPIAAALPHPVCSSLFQIPLHCWNTKKYWIKETFGTIVWYEHNQTQTHAPWTRLNTKRVYQTGALT